MYTEESKNFARYAEILKESGHIDAAEAFEALSDELNLRELQKWKSVINYMGFQVASAATMKERIDE